MPWLMIAKWAGGLLALIGLLWSVYAGIVRPVTKPNPSTHQQADTIINYNIEPKQTFGCTNFRIQKPVKKAEIQNE